MTEHVCNEGDCDGREFANAGALRIHRNAAHGAAAGVCDVCGKPFKNLASHMRAHKIDGGGGPVPSEPGAPTAAAEPSTDDPAAGTGEQAPRFPGSAGAAPTAPSGTRLRDKVRGKLWGDKAPAPDAPAGGPTYGDTKERKPRTTSGRRASTAPILSLLWGGGGMFLERTGADIPVGRTLQFQAEPAGPILDRLIAGSWLDRLLQPLASKKDDVEALGALLALPVLVGVIERSQGAAVALDPLLREAVRVNIVNMAPVVKQRRADEKKFEEACAAIDPELAASGDPVAAMLNAIFAPPPAPPADVNTNGTGEPAPAAV